MYLNNLIEHESGNKKHVPKITRFTENIWRLMNNQVIRYMNAETTVSKFYEFVKDLIRSVEDPNSLDIENAEEVYNSYILPQAYKLNRKFDSLYNDHSNNFLVDSKDTTELFVPTYKDISNLISGTWEDTWEYEQAITILSHDSMEFNTKYNKSTFQFKKDVPTYMLIGINSEVLLMKYYRYLKAYNYTFSTVPLDDFIKYEIFDFLFDDMYKIWCINLFSSIQADTSKVDQFNITKNIVNINDHVSASSLRDAIRDYVEFLDYVKSGKYKLADFLETVFFGNKSYKEISEHRHDNFKISSRSQYTGLTILNDMWLLNVLSIITEREKSLDSQLHAQIKYYFTKKSSIKWMSHFNNYDLVDLKFKTLKQTFM